MEHIFNVSLHEPERKSMYDLFRRCGVKAMHWPARVKAIDYQEIVAGKETDLEFVASALRPVFEEFTEVSDVPLSALYAQLAQRYPSAKFYALLSRGVLLGHFCP